MKIPVPKPGAGMAWRYHYGLKTLKRAYEFSRIATDKEKAGVEEKAEKHQKLVDAGEASWVEYDDDGIPGYDYGEHLGELLDEEDLVLNLLRQAFVISLHHFVEQQIGRHLPKQQYKQPVAFAWLKEFGWQPMETELNELRLAANCAKHSDNNPGKQLCALRPDMFDASKIKIGFDPGHEDVRAYAVEGLRDLGYQVLEAFDGSSALELLKREGHQIQLLLSDVIMPGMSGRDLVDAARQLFPQLRILYHVGLPA